MAFIALDSAERADGHGITDLRDKAEFIGHALRWNSRFDLHPGFAIVWEKVAKGVFYSRAVSELDVAIIEDAKRTSWTLVS